MQKGQKVSEQKQVALRLDSDFHAKIQNLAKKEKRSLHSQVVFVLNAWFDPQALRDRLAELDRTLH